MVLLMFLTFLGPLPPSTSTHRPGPPLRASINLEIAYGLGGDVTWEFQDGCPGGSLGYWNESIYELMCNNPKEDHVDMNAYIKLGEIMSIFWAETKSEGR